MQADDFVPVVEVTRGGLAESVHLAAAVLADADGRMRAGFGNPERLVHWRSAAKPFQARPFVASGAMARFGATAAELAIACASHSGEPHHLETARGLLARGGLVEEDLRCGPHPPFHPPSAMALVRRGMEPGALHNNCSGKHAAMLLLALHLGADTAGYLDPASPVQREIVAFLARHAGVRESEVVVAVDGCSAPTFALPLRLLARAYAGLARALDEPSFDPALASVAGAMVSHPGLVAGTGRLDTALMEAAPGKLIAKVGAEGIYAVAALSADGPVGLALKIADGDADRARSALVVETLAVLGLLSPDALERLRQSFPRAVRNRRGLTVGEVRVRVPLA